MTPSRANGSKPPGAGSDSSRSAGGGGSRRKAAAGPVVRVLADADTVARAAAGELVRIARKVQSKGRELCVALSGGSTPKRTYELLAEPPFRDMVDWKRVRIFFGDERCVPPDHPDSNYRMAREAMLSKLPLAPEHVHRIEAERADLDAAAADYQAEIARAFDVPRAGPPPPFDVVLLGLGPDGHTASLFPGTLALQERERWVVPNFVPELDSYRMTVTYPLIDRAAQVIFLTAGDEKASIVAEVLEGPPDPERLPSQRVHPTKGVLMWIVDTAAASKLTHTKVTRG